MIVTEAQWWTFLPYVLVFIGVFQWIQFTGFYDWMSAVFWFVGNIYHDKSFRMPQWLAYRQILELQPNFFVYLLWGLYECKVMFERQSLSCTQHIIDVLNDVISWTKVMKNYHSQGNVEETMPICVEVNDLAGILTARCEEYLSSIYFETSVLTRIEHSFSHWEKTSRL